MKINKDILILRFSFFLVFQMGGVKHFSYFLVLYYKALIIKIL